MRTLTIVGDNGYLVDDEPKCDFCSMPDPKWGYRAKSFDVEKWKWGSIAGWAACEACSTFIEKNDQEGLTKRSVDTFAIVHPNIVKSQKDYDECLGFLRDVQAMFFKHRFGSRQPIAVLEERPKG